jgi:hypothetical protein
LEQAGVDETADQVPTLGMQNLVSAEHHPAI